MKTIIFVFDINHGIEEVWAESTLAGSVVEGWKAFVDKELYSKGGEQETDMKGIHQEYFEQLDMVIATDTYTGEVTKSVRYEESLNNHILEIETFICSL